MQKIVIFIMLLFSCCSILISQPFSLQGDGTEDSPYQIWDMNSVLAYLDDTDFHYYMWYEYYYQGRTRIFYFIFMQDIGNVSECIGGIAEYFVYYGNWKSLTATTTWDVRPNFFTSNSGTLENIFVEGINLAFITENTVSGKIYNCISNITDARFFVGNNQGTITYCINNGNIKYDVAGDVRIAGIANSNTGTITHCINNGSVSATNYTETSKIACGVGGIVGAWSHSGIVESCINTGIISGQANTGGIQGSAAGGVSTAIITNCINYGFVKGSFRVGGVAGSNGLFLINHCINTGSVVGTDGNVGCITGEGPFSNCYWDTQMCPIEENDH